MAALLGVLAGCEGPPEQVAPDAGPADAPPRPCNPPAPALDGGAMGAPDPAARGELAWAYRDPVLAFPFAQPAVGPDGTVYATASIRLFALAPADGSLLWQAPSAEAEPLIATPLVDESGRILVASTQVALYAFAPDGKQLWRSQLAGGTGTVTAPVRLPHGFALGAGARVFWIDDCGQWIGTYDHSARLSGDLAAAAEGTVYAGEPGAGAVVALGLDAKLRWRTVIGQAPGGLAVGPDGAVIVTTGSAGVVARLDGASGAVRARVPLPARVGAPVLAADGTILVAATQNGAPLGGRVYALAPADLSERWHADLPGQITLLPAVTTAGVVLGISSGAQSSLLLLGDGGAVRFSTPCNGCSFVGTAPALGADGNAYTSALSRMVALRTPGVLDPRSAWPRARSADDANRARSLLP